MTSKIREFFIRSVMLVILYTLKIIVVLKEFENLMILKETACNLSLENKINSLDQLYMKSNK